MGDSSDEATKADKPARISQPAIPVQPDFGPRYRVIGVIGKGGMGEVFRAYDTELKGEVALKVIRGDTDHEGALARFRREIALARKVTSPNVLRVYDIAEHDGLRFLSMEYVDGEDLAALMKRDKTLSIERALQIFRQVCDGLAAAHAQGVVHRDLKPQNVLVDKDGGVRVADFGLARSIGDSGLTASGAIVGSPAYMSPEQVKGDPTDERSDIYSLGVMLYQLATGEPPFRADTPHAVMEMRLHKKPKLLRDVRAEVPAYLEGIAAKCLALNPSARFRTIREVISALDAGSPAIRRRPRWLVPALAAGGLATAGTIAFLLWPRGTHHEPEPPRAPVAAKPTPPPVPTTGPATVLVLGFENHANEPSFDGSLDMLLNYALRRSERLDPIAAMDLRKLAAELGTPDRLDEEVGRKLSARDGIRVLTVRGRIVAKGAAFELVMTAKDASTGETVFEDTSQVPSLDKVVESVGRVANKFRAAMGEHVDPADIQTGLSLSIEADHEFATGLAMGRSGNYPGSIEHLAAAVAKDERFAVAHSQLAIGYRNLLRSTEADEQFRVVLRELEGMGERDRLKFLGDYHSFVTGDLRRAIESYEQLLEKWPRDMAAEVNVAIAYSHQNDAKKALVVGERAAQHHMFTITARENLLELEIRANELERALEEGRKIRKDFARATPAAQQGLALALALSGRRDEAIAAFHELEPLNPSDAFAASADFAIYEGRLNDAAAILDKGVAYAKEHKLGDEMMHLMLAELYQRKGDKARAKEHAAPVVREPAWVFGASMVLLEVGDSKGALAKVAKLANDVAPDRRAVAKLVAAEDLRRRGKPDEAMLAAQEALTLHDTPFAHFVFARAAMDAKHFPEAYAELKTCIARRGEVAIDLVVEVPGLRYIPRFTYELARAQEGLGSPDASKSYQAFLALLHDPDADDPLTVDARKHVR